MRNKLAGLITVVETTDHCISWNFNSVLNESIAQLSCQIVIRTNHSIRVLFHIDEKVFIGFISAAIMGGGAENIRFLDRKSAVLHRIPIIGFAAEIFAECILIGKKAYFAGIVDGVEVADQRAGSSVLA